MWWVITSHEHRLAFLSLLSQKTRNTVGTVVNLMTTLGVNLHPLTLPWLPDPARPQVLMKPSLL